MIALYFDAEVVDLQEATAFMPRVAIRSLEGQALLLSRPQHTEEGDGRFGLLPLRRSEGKW